MNRSLDVTVGPIVIGGFFAILFILIFALLRLPGRCAEIERDKLEGYKIYQREHPDSDLTFEQFKVKLRLYGYGKEQ